MRHIRLIAILTVVLLLTAAKPFAELPKTVQKKTMKAVEQLWPDREVQLKEISGIDEKEAARIGILGAYRLSAGASALGYLIVAQGRSKFDNFEYAVFYDNNLYIKATRILVYREDVGGEIGSKRWLRQFEGKSISDNLVLNQDIQGISGATISCRATVEGVCNITEWINKLPETNGDK